CGMYNRFDKGLQPKQSMLESLLEIRKHRAMLEADVHKLENELKIESLFDEPPEGCTCSQLWNLLSQHLETPLTNPLSFMGVDGDLNTLIKNGTLSREGGLQVQIDQVKSQCADLHHDCNRTMGKLRAINISEDVGFSEDICISGAVDISGNMSISEAIGFYRDISFSGAMNFSRSLGISGTHASLRPAPRRQAAPHNSELLICFPAR
uniref:Myotubularin-related protein 8 n=1 Tax=Camelus bactrianus TaxID=9837 RepID=A0A9W3ER78_CAMBA